MPDYFALLNEPRRPWLDADALKQKFLTLSSEVHPDRVHSLGAAERAAAQERYTQLNAAYQHLTEPKERLRHLLELELGRRPSDLQDVPSDLMDLAMEVGRTCRQADALIAESSKVTSPLLKVQFFERGQEQTDVLRELQRRLIQRQEELNAATRELDVEWVRTEPGSAQRDELRKRLEGIYRLLSYFGRWISQVQQRTVELSF